MPDNDGDVAAAATPLYGIGAPDDKNWDEVERVQSMAPDQGYDLPDPAIITLYKITPQLTSSDDFDAWEAMVVKQLWGLKLHNLIDDKIERPYRNAENAEPWVDLSERVCSWLSYGLDPALNREISMRSGNIRWADKFMSECKRCFKAKGHAAITTATIKFFRTRRTEFNNIEEFITAVKNRYMTARDLKGHVVPYHMMTIITIELSQIPELKSFIDLKNDRLEDEADPGSKVSTDDVFKYCQSIIDKVRLSSDSFTR